MRQTLNWGLFAVVVVSLLLVARPTQLGGPASYVVVDGRSMEPTYSDGDLVVARAQDSYNVGDVITYEAPTRTAFSVIHRVVDVIDDGYITQGDNMERPDGWTASHGAIHGAAQFHVPMGGLIIGFVRRPAAILGLIAGMVSFEYLKRRPTTATTRTPDPGTEPDVPADGPDVADQRRTPRTAGA